MLVLFFLFFFEGFVSFFNDLTNWRHYASSASPRSHFVFLRGMVGYAGEQTYLSPHSEGLVGWCAVIVCRLFRWLSSSRRRLVQSDTISCHALSRPLWADNNAVQSQKAVSSYFTSKQILPLQSGILVWIEGLFNIHDVNRSKWCWLLSVDGSCAGAVTSRRVRLRVTAWIRWRIIAPPSYLFRPYCVCIRMGITVL